MATEEIEISQLELAEDLAPDMVLPVETTTETKATTLQKIKEWLGSFFVDKTSDEEIGGVKKFTSGETSFLLGKQGANCRFISSDKKYGVIVREDENDFYFLITNQDDANGSWNAIRPFRMNLTNGVLSSEANAYVPDAYLANSVVVTRTISKGSNGYVKLGNGIIICWGGVASGTSVNVTFPTAFTATPRVASSTTQGSGGGYERAIVDITTTGFASKGYGGAKEYTSHYIAIGY
jgi:hypothetical protein